MRKLILYIILIAGLGVVGQGCYEEEKLVALGDEPVLSEKDLPQGDQPYDDRIMEYFEDYGLLTFYRFAEKEFWWTPTKDIRPKPAGGKEGGTSPGYEGIQADEKFVGELVELLDNEFFAYYTKEYLYKRMSKKFLLMGELTYTPPSLLNPEYASKYRVYSHVGYDHIAINMANADVLLMTDDAIRNFRSELNAAFLEWQVDFGFIEDSPEFLLVTEYSNSYNITSVNGIKNLYKAGLISALAQIPQNDWKEYIRAIVSHTYEELAGEIDPVAFKPGTTTLDAKRYLDADPHLGMLNPNSKKGWDSSKKIMEKYKIITTYFKEKYNLDLQAIGNGVKSQYKK